MFGYLIEKAGEGFPPKALYIPINMGESKVVVSKNLWMARDGVNNLLMKSSSKHTAKQVVRIRGNPNSHYLPKLFHHKASHCYICKSTRTLLISHKCDL